MPETVRAAVLVACTVSGTSSSRWAIKTRLSLGPLPRNPLIELRVRCRLKLEIELARFGAPHRSLGWSAGRYEARRRCRFAQRTKSRCYPRRMSRAGARLVIRRSRGKMTGIGRLSAFFDKRLLGCIGPDCSSGLVGRRQCEVQLPLEWHVVKDLQPEHKSDVGFP